MRHYLAMLKKENLEGLRSYRFLIMLAVFLAFGIMSPLVAKLTPFLLDNLVPEEMAISLPEPSAIDSWSQFFKNISQMGLIVMVIVFSGILANEINRGTLINLLTKSLSRVAVILAKYTYMVLAWSASLLLAGLVTWAYTVYLWPDDKMANLLFSVFCLWLFGDLLLAVLLFASTLTNGVSGGLLITGSVVVALMIANIFPAVQKYNPLALSGLNVGLLVESVELADLYWPMAVAVIASATLVWSAVWIFAKKQL